MSKAKTIDEVRDYIQDDSWVDGAIQELEEEFTIIDQEEDKGKAPLASKPHRHEPEI